MTEPNKQSMKTNMTAAESSKLLKATLTRSFPGTKFSVRMSRGTAYGSIDISYEDGPAYEDVDTIASGFEGKSFDGSIDLEYHKETSYCPVHGALFAGTDGTSGSRGHVTPTGLPEIGETNTLCCEKGYLCNFGLGYIHVTRQLSIEAEAFLVEAFNIAQGHEYMAFELCEHRYKDHVSQYAKVYRKCDGGHLHGSDYEYRDFCRKADLRNPSKMLSDAKAKREATLAKYAELDAAHKAKVEKETKEQAAAEIRGEQKEFRLSYYAHTKPNLN